MIYITPMDEKMAEKIEEPANKTPKLDEDAVSDNNAEKPQPVSEDGKPLSKRQLKRMAKRENFHQWKMEKRMKEKEKRKQKRREEIERGEPRTKPSKKEMKKNKMSDSQCKVRVAIDSSFDDFMSEREINSHVLQMQHAYAANRRAANPLQFYVTSVSGGSESRLVNVGDYKGWDVNFHSEHYLDLFKKEDIVYLSSDSPHVMTTVDEEKVYIIGGLVDHNKHKGLCHRKAEEVGVAHARLPIEEYIKLQTRKVLACNHVFEILLRYTELKDWEKAFFSAIPKRKGLEEKGDENTKEEAQSHVTHTKTEEENEESHNENEDNEEQSDEVEEKVQNGKTSEQSPEKETKTNEHEEEPAKKAKTFEEKSEIMEAVAQ